MNDASLGLEYDGHGAGDAPIYPQACVRAWSAAGLYVVANGGGGGAAQLMPATLLGDAIDAAHVAAVGARGHDRLVRLFVGVDTRIAALREGPIYRGSSAHAVAAACEGEVLWLGVAGLGRAYRVERDRCVVVTRDDSLLSDVLDAGLSLETGFSHDGVVTAVLGMWRSVRAGWQPVATPLAGAEGFVLATEPAHRAGASGVLERLARDALRTPVVAGTASAMWRGLRAHCAHVDAFDRGAAVMVLRPRRS
jgi:hypothetical protein